METKLKVKKTFEKIPQHVEQAASIAVDSAYHVHMNLGPGLLERTYERFMEIEINKRGHTVRRQVRLPINYEGAEYDEYYTIDMIVDDCLIIELKAVENVLPVHKHQLLTYLKLSGLRLGLLMNFDDTNIGNGTTRMIN
jgi:GxxExxY protein